MEGSKLKPCAHGSRMDYMFYCRGCEAHHAYDPRWKFNGDLKAPTFTPSLLVTWPNGNICHLYVTNGKIQYLGDCWHELKGKTIEMEDVE